MTTYTTNPKRRGRPPKIKILYCSFCDKAQDQVRKLIAATRQNTFICNECVELCMDIIREEQKVPPLGWTEKATQ